VRTFRSAVQPFATLRAGRQRGQAAAGTAVLRPVRCRSRGDQRVVPPASIPRDQRPGFSDRPDRAARDRRDEGLRPAVDGITSVRAWRLACLPWARRRASGLLLNWA